VTAILSPCGTYRYSLTRSLGQPGFKACVIMVNPSTADAETDDATIRKLIGFGTRLKWSEFTVVNKFAYRATDVNELRTAVDPIGPLNDHHIFAAMIQASMIVVAWGSLNKLPLPLWRRWRVVAGIARALDKPLYSWGVCKDGHPCHPVMLGYDTPLTIWEPPYA
jgi:hypothetical protein